ncbi:hypothetical protein Nepgr_030573 [Nepenthes gracilis]|uniref:Purple acid phosphatase n=1 Tax=Nepenthes gracilis TaxID=150966 RepID=A0AAD3TEV0_NEPGR|nr:hypothetical protein Nepgr_030573 [Nepenthes gracilis]
MAVRRLFLVIAFAGVITSVHPYTRPPPRETLFIPPTADSSAPEQVHVSVSGIDNMRISWITKDSVPAIVEYGTSSRAYNSSANGTSSSYSFFLYKSGHINDVVIGPLKPNTVYYYRCGSDHSSPEFSLKTPPAQFPIKLVVIGDLGQTGWTSSTLQHVAESRYDMLLLPGDLSYADFWQPRWDSYGRLVEPLASQRPWMVTIGNHEVESVPVIHKPAPFTAYNARWRMPFEESGSTSNLYYSFDVAGVHVIMLGSYIEFDRTLISING